MLILSAIVGTVGATEAARATTTVVDSVGQTAWRPAPPITPSWTGLIQVSGARLWAWDSGGSGEAIVLLHPFTGSDAIWGYQYEAFTRAGYRVVAYSRRGFGQSAVSYTHLDVYKRQGLSCMVHLLKPVSRPKAKFRLNSNEKPDFTPLFNRGLP